jgi:hypothetical protein
MIAGHARKLIVASACLLLLGGANACAQTIFNFNFTFASSLSDGANYGTFTGAFITDPTPDVAGSYTVSRINATLGGLRVSLLPPDTLGGNDNIINYPTSTDNPGYFTINGVSFMLPDGTPLNIYYYGEPGAYDYAITPVDQLNQGAAYTGTVTLRAPGPVAGGGVASFIALCLAGLLTRLRFFVGLGRRALGHATRRTRDESVGAAR